MRLSIFGLVFVLSSIVFMSNDNSKVRADESKGTIDSLITGAIKGKETGLPLPRFVSLKSRRTNMRVGPSFDHKISWVYIKKGVPVEVIREFEFWRQIRDSEGQTGWVHKALLSRHRSIIVSPWSNETFHGLYNQPEPSARRIAKLQAGVYSDLEECSKDWCLVSGDNYRGWLKASEIWGVYPGEQVE